MQMPMTQALSVVSLIMVFLTFVSFSRAVMGPGPEDRIVAVNVIGTKAVVIVATISFLRGTYHFLDVCLVYALLNFIATCGVSRYLEHGRVWWHKGGSA